MPTDERCFRVRGVLLATHDLRCLDHEFDMHDVDHKAFTIDVEVTARLAEIALVAAVAPYAEQFVVTTWHDEPRVEEIF